MPHAKPQFTARITFTFSGAKPTYSKFTFGEDGHRRVPIRMDGIEGLNTLGMWVDGPREFAQGDEVEVECCVIWAEGFRNVVKPGVLFELWDGDFFAKGEVIEKFDDAW